MNEIQIDSAAYGIGRTLNRINWYDMTLEEAYKFCMEKAEKRGATKEEQKVITKLALKYVISQNLPQ